MKIRSAAVLYLFLACFLTVAQDRTESPSPEFFGVYAVQGGRLASLAGGKGTFTPPATRVPIYLLREAKTSPLDLPTFGPEVQFILYDSSITEPSRAVEVFRLPFGRNIVQQQDPMVSLLGSVQGRAASGAAAVPLNQFIMARLDALEIKLLFKPVDEKKQKFLAIPQQALQAGYYVLFVRTTQGLSAKIDYSLFAVPGPVQSYCVDLLKTAGFLGMIEAHDNELMNPYTLTAGRYSPCGNVPGRRGVQPVSSPISPPPNGALPPAACTNQADCSSKATAALNRQDLASGAAFLAKSVQIERDQPETWNLLVRLYAALGRVLDLTLAAETLLRSGGTLTIPVCKEGRLLCAPASLNLSLKAVSLTEGRQSKVVSEAPVSGAEATSLGIAKVSEDFSAAKLKFDIGGNSYKLIPEAMGVQGCQTNRSFYCPDPGPKQQLLVASYVAAFFRAMARTGMPPAVKPSAPKPEPANTEAPKPVASFTSESLEGKCTGATGTNRRFLIGGQLYAEKKLSLADGKQRLVFFDENAKPLTSLTALVALNRASWTLDNIVRSPSGASPRSETISALAESFSQMGKYQAAQDVLVKLIVKTTIAGVTGGGSLAGIVGEIAWSAVRAQFTNPQVLLRIAAYRGLELSAQSYRDMETILKNLPATDAGVFDEARLSQIYELYRTGNAAELIYGKLAASLMPQNWTQLGTEALGSVASQFLRQVPSTGQVTGPELWTMVQRLWKSMETVPKQEATAKQLQLAIETLAAWDKNIQALADQSRLGCQP